MAYRSNNRWPVEYYSSKENALKAAKDMTATARETEKSAEKRGECIDAPYYGVSEIILKD